MNLVNDLFRIDGLSSFVGIFVVFFTLLVVIYSIGFMHSKKRGLKSYYLYILLTVFASLGAVFSNDFILFMIFWGILGVTLFLLIGFGDRPGTQDTAKKAFIIVAGCDAFMLLGIAIIWHISGTLQMDRISIALNSKLATIAYLSLAIGAFAKAGCMPFHTWVPDTAEDAPIPVTAYLPASLDKLLGIYLLARISIDIFKMNNAMNIFLMFIGSFTIVAAVMMALIQHDLKRLLGYHAVSQVGYMVLGIGTGSPVGIAGGLFHMLNNAIYKSCLFFSGGVVEKKTGTAHLEELGGLAGFMPVTFITFLIASFAISGVPPFNGFASKWMIYQGVIESGRVASKLWIVWLVAAMFGSALTLASFMKAAHALFLGQASNKVLNNLRNVKCRFEITPMMWIPGIILALLCIIFGIFVYNVPLRVFILPSVKMDMDFSGIWRADFATLSIVIGLIIGCIIYYAGRAAKVRRVPGFIGGEMLEGESLIRVSGADFYNTIKEIGVFKRIYKLAENKIFDIYNIAVTWTNGFIAILRYLHNGILSTYLAWSILGMIILLYILFR